jgi:hypothetical protein
MILRGEIWSVHPSVAVGIKGSGHFHAHAVLGMNTKMPATLLKGNRGIPIRNESEPSSKYFLAESSDKDISAQYLRPNIHPIYHRHLLPIQHASDAPFGWFLLSPLKQCLVRSTLRRQRPPTGRRFVLSGSCSDDALSRGGLFSSPMSPVGYTAFFRMPSC